MAEKIDVASGDPYRADGGKFGTSPAQKLEDSIKALAGKSFTPSGDNSKKVEGMRGQAVARLATLRGVTKDEVVPRVPSWTNKDDLDSATRNYSADSAAINGMLRDAQGDDSKIPKGDRKDIALLDAQMRDDIQEKTLYRGMFADIGTIQEGGIINSHAFTSTSKDPIQGEYGSDPNGDFTAKAQSEVGAGKNRTSYVMNITIPKGSKGLDIDKSGLGEDESEVLLPRGTIFKINKIGKPVNAENAVDEPYSYTPLDVTAVFPTPKTPSALESWVKGNDNTDAGIGLNGSRYLDDAASKSSSYKAFIDSFQSHDIRTMGNPGLSTLDISKVKRDDTQLVGPDKKSTAFARDAIQKGTPLQPIVLDKDSSLLDGRHRINALEQLGITKVDAIQDGTGTPLKDIYDKASSKDSKLGDFNPTGTEAEAEAFVKDSVMKDTIYHGTSSSSAESIKKDGFNASKSISDRYFGDGTYLTGDKEAASFYAKNAGGNNGTVLATKLNVQNPYIDDSNKTDYTIGKYSVGQFTYDMYQWGVANKHWKDPASYEKKTEKIAAYNKLTRDFANHLLETHDAIFQTNSKGVDLAVIKDPKKIMVINNG